jgi:hypothetical protein
MLGIQEILDSNPNMKADCPEGFSWFSSVSSNARRVPEIRPWPLPNPLFTNLKFTVSWDVTLL